MDQPGLTGSVNHATATSNNVAGLNGSNVCNGFQRTRLQPVIAAEPRHHITCGQLKSLVQGVGLPPVGFDDKMGKTVTIGLQNLTASVRGSTINDNILKIGIVLPKDRIQTFPKEVALVETDGNHRDSGPFTLGHCPPTFSSRSESLLGRIVPNGAGLISRREKVRRLHRHAHPRQRRR